MVWAPVELTKPERLSHWIWPDGTVVAADETTSNQTGRDCLAAWRAHLEKETQQ